VIRTVPTGAMFLCGREIKIGKCSSTLRLEDGFPKVKGGEKWVVTNLKGLQKLQAYRV
jgi:hypothetical protein